MNPNQIQALDLGCHKIQAPAKLNLRLKVTGLRSDGYHLLSMLNVNLDLADELEISVKAGKGITLTCCPGPLVDLAALGCDADNLVYRAAHAFLNRFALKFALDIKLFKRIPLGSGLGGGSSDAAAALRLLAAIFEPALTEMNFGSGQVKQELEIMSPALGADVPYFLRGGLCAVSGIGENVTGLSSNEFYGWPALLVLAPVHSATPAVFAALRSGRTSGWGADQQLTALAAHPQRQLNPGEILELVENDLTPAILSLHSSLRELYEFLKSEKDFVCGFTGSGSALFVLPKQSTAHPVELQPRLEARFPDLGLKFQNAACRTEILT